MAPPQRVLVGGDHIAVHRRPEVGRALGPLRLFHRLRRQGAGLRQGLGAQALQPGLAVGFGQTQGLEVRAAPGRILGRGEVGAALGDHAPEQACRQGRGGQHADREGAGGMAQDGHLARIAAELVDIGLHPLQPGDLVHQAVSARPMAAFAAERGRGQEAERADPVGDGDEHHALLGVIGAVIQGHAGQAAVEAAAVDPGDDGQLLTRRLGRGPDIDEQAVLAERRGRAHLFGQAGLLHAAGAEGGGLAHAGPRLDRLGRLPAQVAHRRRRERDALELAEPVDRRPGDAPAGHAGFSDLGHGRSRRRRQRQRRQCSPDLAAHPGPHRLVQTGSNRTASIAQPSPALT
jgi:hypothetical protein